MTINFTYPGFYQLWAIRTDGMADLEHMFHDKADAKFWLEQARREHPEQDHDLVTSWTNGWERDPNA